MSDSPIGQPPAGAGIEDECRTDRRSEASSRERHGENDRICYLRLAKDWDQKEYGVIAEDAAQTVERRRQEISE